MSAGAARLPHVLTRKELARVLAPTYAEAAQVDEDEAYERMERAVQLPRVLDGLYRGLHAAFLAKKGPRTSEDKLIDELAEGLGKRRARVHPASMTPAISAAMVLINLELGYAPSMMANALESEKGQALLEKGLRDLGKHLLDELIK